MQGLGWGFSLVVLAGCTPGESVEDEIAGCELITDMSECMGESACVWQSASRATRTGDVCTLEPTGLCFHRSAHDGAAGCGSLEGCDDSSFANPYYRVEQGGTVVLVDFCGGTPPDSVSACNSGLASEADPPECACACELQP